VAIEYITYEDEEYQGYEIYDLINGEGEISLGSHHEGEILFGGNSVASHYIDSKIDMRHTLVSSSYNSYTKALQKIRHSIKIEEEVVLSQSLADLLGFFESGQLLLGEYLLGHYDYFAYDESLTHHYYPNDHTLVGTQATSLLQEMKIHKYMESIKAGKREKIITVSAFRDNTLYIIEGHHKLEAYQRLNQKPFVVHIVLQNRSAIKQKECRFIVGQAKELFDAIYEGKCNKISTMLSTNASLTQCYNREGLNPYHFAVMLAKEDIVRLFLDHGVNINTLDHQGKAMLHYAMGSDKHTKIMELLIQKGATIDILTHTSKETPLVLAIEKGYFKSAKKLLQYGADPKFCIQDLISIASHRVGAKEMIQVLIKYGLKPTKQHQESILYPPAREAVNSYLSCSDDLKNTSYPNNPRFEHISFGMLS